MQLSMSCLGDNTIGAFVEGKLEAADARQVKDHLAVCQECRSLVRAVMGNTVRADALTGQVLAQTYQVKHLLGSGAMGMVYAGEHLRLTRPVAIKILGEALRNHPDALERFRREAQVCSRLGNSHIVDVLDFNTLPDGTPFMVMEQLEGEDLAQRLSIDGPMAPATVAALMRQICSALATAHDEGVLHRDLKPSNIFLCPGDGEQQFLVKVLDFGISKVRGALATLTGSQEILGTPYYMSPEMAQARHSDVDQRSDLFSLGAIAYEALACRRAFDADSIPGALYRIVHEEPEPIEQLSPSVPAGLARLVASLLSKDRAGRPESARAVTDGLARLQLAPVGPTGPADPFAGTQLSPVPETLKTRASRWRALPLVVALLAAAGAATWLLWPSHPPVAVLSILPDAAPPSVSTTTVPAAEAGVIEHAAVDSSAPPTRVQPGRAPDATRPRPDRPPRHKIRRPPPAKKKTGPRKKTDDDPIL